jgi:HlyD family secretion protein
MEQAVQPKPPIKAKAPRRKPRRWLPYAGAAILVALIVIGLWPRPAVVETGKAAMGPLRTTINEEGKTRIRQRYVIAAPVAGQLRRIPFKAGALVRSNETVLAVIDPLTAPMLDQRTRATAEARRDTARANLERAKAQHAFAASELKRATTLSTANTISVQELETAQWRESSAAKELAAAESALRQAEAELIEAALGARSTAPIDIRAPVSGRVLRVFEESSRPVAAGAAILEIGDPSDLEVVIEILSRDAIAAPPGTPVELEQWGGREPLQARVRHAEPAAFTKVSALGVEEQRVNLIADITTPWEARQDVGDQFRVEARIITWQTNATLKVPSGAIFNKNGKSSAFVVRDGKAHLTMVQVGRSSGVEVEVQSGLQDGDELIVYPGDRIHDGLRVERVKIGH